MKSDGRELFGVFLAQLFHLKWSVHQGFNKISAGKVTVSERT